MRQKETKQLYEYWMDLFWKAGNPEGPSVQPAWPQRSDIQPSECRSLLGDIFILEVQEQQLTYRLAGTRLCAMYGHELKGQPFDATFEGQDRDAATRWTAQAGPERYVAVMSSTAVDTGGNRIVLETLLMPVACNTQHANRILGLTVACSPSITLGNRKVDNQRIRSVRTLRPWENIDSHEPVMETAIGGSGSLRGLRSAPSNDVPPQIIDLMQGKIDQPRHVAHLRVFEGGKADA